MPSSRRAPRAHLVLVPGFAGFDALGQIEYYAGVTPEFAAWREASGRDDAVLHYFDDLPTSSVTTRAHRLTRWLATRVARGEIEEGDGLALVGHSTGGLDIRRAVRDLAAPGTHAISVDGADEDALRVEPARILALRLRLVFLSVPQLGTNIADWVRGRSLARDLVVGWLRSAVAAARLPTADELEAWATGRAADLLGSDLVRAARDALREMDPTAVPPGADRATWVAGAQEAEAGVALWLRHMATDFGAIDDLAAGAEPDPGAASPAHWGDAGRAAERAAWAAHGVETRSYATVAPRPFSYPDPGAVPVLDPYRPWSWPAASGLAGTDLPYRAAYAACAGGPFAPAGAVPPLALFAGKGAPWPLERYDNDGIVNTASMVWPDGDATRLVHADHGDVIGHYEQRRARAGSARRLHAYDLLGSASGFDAGAFRKVWWDVFEFAAADS